MCVCVTIITIIMRTGMCAVKLPKWYFWRKMHFPMFSQKIKLSQNYGVKVIFLENSAHQYTKTVIIMWVGVWRLALKQNYHFVVRENLHLHNSWYMVLSKRPLWLLKSDIFSLMRVHSRTKYGIMLIFTHKLARKLNNITCKFCYWTLAR